MSTKHTPTPWESVDNQSRECSGEKIIRAACDESFITDGVYSADGALIVASVNSYAAHCKDPVEAAESDLLGRMREHLKLCRRYFKLAGVSGPVLDGAISLLAETKETCCQRYERETGANAGDCPSDVHGVETKETK